MIINYRNVLNITPNLGKGAVPSPKNLAAQILSGNLEYISNFKAGETFIFDRILSIQRLVEITKEQKPFRASSQEFLYTKLKMFLDGDEVGYLSSLPDYFDHWTKSSVLGYSNLKDDLVYKVSTLCSIKGDKYRGIGTQLLKTAVQQSKKEGYDGKLFLQANNSGDLSTRSYRGLDSPVEFYQKFGFKLVDEHDKTNDFRYLSHDKRSEYLLELLNKPILFQ